MTLAGIVDTYQPVLLVFVFASLALMGGGYWGTGPRAKWLRIAGWIGFGLYWPTQAPHYFEISDPTNAWFCLLAPVFTGFIAFHEYRSIQWKEDPVALRWLSGSVFVAAFTYFLVNEIPLVSNAIIQWTAWQSALVTEHVFGVPAYHAQDVGGNWNIYIHGGEYAVTVILACTAIQSMMIFVGAVACIKAPLRAKLIALAASVLPIYVLNLFRNAGIVWGYKIVEWNPFGWGPEPSGSLFWTYYATTEYGSFVWMHSVIGKGGALLALVVIALIVFRVLPELHEAILDLFDLRKRNRPGFFDAPATRASAEGTDGSVASQDAAGVK